MCVCVLCVCVLVPRRSDLYALQIIEKDELLRNEEYIAPSKAKAISRLVVELCRLVMRRVGWLLMGLCRLVMELCRSGMRRAGGWACLRGASGRVGMLAVGGWADGRASAKNEGVCRAAGSVPYMQCTVPGTVPCHTVFGKK